MDYPVAGLYYEGISDDVFNLLPSYSSGIDDDYTYTFMIFPSSVVLGASGWGSFPGTTTWYRSDSIQWVTLGVHEIGTGTDILEISLLSHLLITYSLLKKMHISSQHRA